MQEVFARLWVKRATNNIVDLKAYLYKAVRNETINFITRHKEVFEFYKPFEEILLESESPHDRLIAKEILLLVLAYANTLPEKRRQIFLLHIQNKLSTQEIADELGIAQKTVQNQLGNALKGLKTYLTPSIIILFISQV